MQLESPGLAARQRNPRGQGDRLRQEIIDAARDVLAETGNLDRLTLRGVARRVGIAATSVYLHFPDAEHLAVAALEQTFTQLSAATQAAAGPIADPAEALLARCRAYGRFGLEHPGHYRVMFHLDLMPSLAAGDPEDSPGQRAFRRLESAVEACLTAGAGRPYPDPHRLASLVWATEHGLVSAMLARPGFAWGDVDDLVTEAVSRVMGFDYAVPPAASGRGSDS